MLGDGIAIFLSLGMVIAGLLPPRLELAKWREQRFAPCTFGRFVRFVLFAVCFSFGAVGWHLVVTRYDLGWWGRVVTWWVVGWVAAGAGSLAYLIVYVWQLWVLDAFEIDRREMRAAANR